MVLPSWRDLDPGGQFIGKLFRKPLPTSVHHQLLYTYANPAKFKPNENSDGVVPLFSQLHLLAQKESSKNIGFNSNHTGILKDDVAIDHIIKSFQAGSRYFCESLFWASQPKQAAKT